jgi:hypothetical protein
MGEQKGVCATCQQQGIDLKRGKLGAHQAYGRSCDGVGDAPQAVYVPKMPTILHERRPIGDDGWTPGSMRIVPSEPLYYFSSYGQNWSRVLMLEDGHYLRVQLTPLNPTVQSEWDEMLAAKMDYLSWGGSSWTIWGSGRSAESRSLRERDHYTRTLPEEIVRHMHYHLGRAQAERLLTGDLWAEIAPMWPEDYQSPYEVSDWLGRCGYNGGIPLEKVRKHPPTREEIYALADQKRHEEREARIAVAVGDAAPLTEEERQLGNSLEGHDWSYSYSDCGATWQRGRDHQESLKKALLAMAPDRARIIWQAFVHPSNEQYWKCPV